MEEGNSRQRFINVAALPALKLEREWQLYGAKGLGTP
jgi:hypothetical protein